MVRIFTSATLSVRKDFSHYQHQMGLEDAITQSWDSPFDYQNQAVLFVPEEMPDPNNAAYTQAVVRSCLPLIKAAQGHAFLLFTSLRAMREAKQRLADEMHASGFELPLLMQGEASRSELLEQFRNLRGAVLLGSQSL